MNKDLSAINEEIGMLLEKPISMEKYQKLGVLYVCKEQIEKSLKTDKSTVSEIIEYKADNIGARATLMKISPIISKLVKDLEIISPTISGEFIKKIKEM